MITFTEFVRPNGLAVERVMTKIKPADAAFLTEHNVKISMENTGPFLCIWTDDGRKMADDPDTPDEITYIVPSGEECEVSMRKICGLIRKRQLDD